MKRKFKYYVVYDWQNINQWGAGAMWIISSLPMITQSAIESVNKFIADKLTKDTKRKTSVIITNWKGLD